MLGKIIIEECKGMIGLSWQLIKLRLQGPRFTLQNGPWPREEGISSEHEDFLNDIALSEQPGLNQRPYSFVFSILAHGMRLD